MRLFEYFDRIYIVFLPERSDRVKHMEKQLIRLGLENKTVWFSGLKYTEPDGFPKASVRGCVMSHYTILNQALKDGLEKILILQDDCTFSNYLIRNEQAIVKELANTYWDFAYLGHGGKIRKSRNYFLKANPGESIMLTHFCAYHKHGIPHLIKLIQDSLNRPSGSPEGGPMYFDGYMNFLRHSNPNLVTLTASRTLGRQFSSPSNLAPNKLDKNILIAPILKLTRNIKNSVLFFD